MKYIIYLTIFSLGVVIYLYRKGRKDAYKEPSNDEEIFSEFEDAEHSPENIKLNFTLKILSLRNRLNKIEDERSQTKKEK